jgi:2-oxo-4-hydroxy-4-carboxy-5-ureidoimidazoline decarboxylase
VSSWTLDTLNAAPGDETLRAALSACCAARSWGSAMIAGRPYRDEAALYATSDGATLELDDAGIAEALAGHGAWSRQEQAGVSGADVSIIDQLDAANAAYEELFGHVYLVCATGKTADELLAICQARLVNDPDTERAVVLDELAKINRLRLAKLLHEEVS